MSDNSIQKTKSKLSILYLAPHLSTGGMPAFLLKRLQALSHSRMELIVVEYANWSDEYVVQKNQIKVLSDAFYTLGENKMELINIIKKHHVNIVHIEEMVEDSVNAFSVEMVNALYSNNRTWNIVETCHNISFNPDKEKTYHPDAYIFCTPYHLRTFEKMPSKKFLIEYPIEKNISEKNIKLFCKKLLGIDTEKFHVLNVGLWTPGKNQSEGIEIAKNFPNVEFHFVGNQADNFKHYWELLMKDIPDNVTIWGERSDVNLFMTACDAFMFNSTWECNPLAIREAASFGLPIMARNLPQYEKMFDGYILSFEESNKFEKMKEIINGWEPTNIPNSSALFDFKVSHAYIYKQLMDLDKTVQKINFNIHFVNKPFLEITGLSTSEYLVKFMDKYGIVIYENRIKTNHWVKVNREWFTDWNIKVWEDKKLILDYGLNYSGKRVFISIESSSLGDTIAWVPYLEEFRKKHNCQLIVSTFKNSLFEKSYPDIEFVKPGTVVNNVEGMYSIGWFYNSDKEPVLPNTIPLQKAATNILGLEYKEIKPLLSFEPTEQPVKNKYVTIATNSTAGCKFWTKENWQKVINYLSENDYLIINVSLEDNPFDNCEQLSDRSMQNTMNYIYYSEFFIGLSSGLSWLAWALDKQVVMISNFTEEDHEFQCIRPVNKSVCHGCWNSPRYKFDKSWDWCPIHSNTSRMYECQKSITSNDVIYSINTNKLI
jgi:autotransporter strand-loop-strand O-heptosyltransferase